MILIIAGRLRLRRGELITSLDDFNHKLLYADFFERKTTWAHIRAAESVMLTYGIPLCYMFIHCGYSALSREGIASEEGISSS
ncbi:MAG TPA: hypothetical protein VMW37_05230 [Dehalococcoidales bacterium]|nr:hypothetical protein [Dehalococcoidales bacterium]